MCVNGGRCGPRVEARFVAKVLHIRHACRTVLEMCARRLATMIICCIHLMLIPDPYPTSFPFAPLLCFLFAFLLKVPEDILWAAMMETASAEHVLMFSPRQNCSKARKPARSVVQYWFPGLFTNLPSHQYGMQLRAQYLHWMPAIYQQSWTFPGSISPLTHSTSYIWSSELPQLLTKMVHRQTSVVHRPSCAPTWKRV